MRFQDIKKFTRGAAYSIHMPWEQLPFMLSEWINDYKCNFNPDFQRGHVWTREDQIKYIEYKLKGGIGANEIFFNDPSWNDQKEIQDMVLVDGLQRVTAVLAFLWNEFPVFGGYYKDYTDGLRRTEYRFVVHVNDLKTRKEVLRWYIDMNSCGIAHSSTELDRVRSLIEAES